MWSVLRRDILIPDQPRLEWASSTASPSLDLGTFGNLYSFDFVPDSTAINQPYLLPQTPSPVYLPNGIIEGTQSRVGAVCVAWTSNGYAGVEGYPQQFVNIRLGTRYGVRLSAHRRLAFEPNGVDTWHNHLGISYSHGLFELYDGSVGAIQAINHSAVMTQSTAHAIVAGFVKVDGQMRLIAWMSELHAEASSPFSHFTAFGAGTAFLEMPVDEEFVCDAPVLITWTTADHGVTLHLAAEKIGPWDSHDLALPQSSEQLMSNAGTTLASLRPRHANFLSPAFQRWSNSNPPSPSVVDYQKYGSVPPVDLHGFHEVTRQQSGDYFGRLVWFGACMGYAHNDVASWLNSGQHSNIHHDQAVNQRLSEITLTAVSLTAPGSSAFAGQEIVNCVVECTPAVPSPGSTQGLGTRVAPLNEYSGKATTNIGWTMNVLVSLYRRDSITPYWAASYSEISLATEFFVRLSIVVYDGQFQSKGSCGTLVSITSQQANELFAGDPLTLQISDAGTSGPLRGTVTIQASG